MNIMRFRPFFFILSSFLILVSIYSIVRWQFQPSIDFVGGSVYEFKLPNVTDKSQLEAIFKAQNIEIKSISVSDSTYLMKFKDVTSDEKNQLEQKIISLDSGYQELRFETLGPSLGQELLKKTFFAILLSSIALLIFIGSRFSDVSFGISAVLAMLHDAFILVGSFSLLGHFFGAELDSLFVTALLTTLSSSVHDTVVTFNRIRELKRDNYKMNWVDMANLAVTQTLVRSTNNSMTIIFMLFALVVLGGESTRWFATALLIGVVCGTYSSTAVAIPLVLFIKNRQKK